MGVVRKKGGGGGGATGPAVTQKKCMPALLPTSLGFSCPSAPTLHLRPRLSILTEGALGTNRTWCARVCCCICTCISGALGAQLLQAETRNARVLGNVRASSTRQPVKKGSKVC